MEVLDQIRAFIEAASRGLVNESDLIKVDLVDSGPRTLCVVIASSPSDSRFLVGRNGATLKSIEHLAHSIAAKHRYHIYIILNETS